MRNRELAAMKVSSSSKQEEDRMSTEPEEEDDDHSGGGGEGGILIGGSAEEGLASTQVTTFSRRRNALLRRARELAMLCDSEVGLIIFACTGHLYEYASTSMKQVIERYDNQKGENHQALVDGPGDIKVLLDEMASLKLQVQNLQETNRRLMGEFSPEVGIKDLQVLENQLELSLSAVRLRKDQLRNDHLNELQLKRNRVLQENIELKETMDLIDRQNSLISEKDDRLLGFQPFYNERTAESGAEMCQSTYEHINGRYDLNVPMEYLYGVAPSPNQDDATTKSQ